MDERNKVIMRASGIAIIGNVGLAILKGIVGIASNSIAIALDGINSLVDAMSSVVAIIGTKLAQRAPDRKHPLGYGRSEYLSSVTIAALILSAGAMSLVESVKSIINPSTPEYTTITLVLVVFAAAVKGLLGVYLLRSGKKVDAGSLIGSGTDSMMDACVSGATFVAAVLYITLGLQVEAWLAAGIAILIIKSGASLLLDTISKIHGERVRPEVVSKVEQVVRSVDGVHFTSNLMLQDNGPNRITGSVHLTVDGNMTVAEFDALAREVQKRVKKECDVFLMGVTPYASTDSNDDSMIAKEVRGKVARIVWGREDIVELRGMFVDPTTKTVLFDAIAEYGAGELPEIKKSLGEACTAECPDWDFEIRVIPNASD